MTNIIATVVVCLVTNVSEYTPPDPQGWYHAPPLYGFTNLYLNTDGGSFIIGGSDPSEKTVTTTVRREHRATMKYQGREYVYVLKSDVVSESVKRYKRSEQWEEIEIEVLPVWTNITAWTNLSVTGTTFTICGEIAASNTVSWQEGDTIYTNPISRLNEKLDKILEALEIKK